MALPSDKQLGLFANIKGLGALDKTGYGDEDGFAAAGNGAKAFAASNIDAMNGSALVPETPVDVPVDGPVPTQDINTGVELSAAQEMTPPTRDEIREEVKQFATHARQELVTVEGKIDSLSKKEELIAAGTASIDDISQAKQLSGQARQQIEMLIAQYQQLEQRALSAKPPIQLPPLNLSLSAEPSATELSAATMQVTTAVSNAEREVEGRELQEGLAVIGGAMMAAAVGADPVAAAAVSLTANAFEDVGASLAQSNSNNVSLNTAMKKALNLNSFAAAATSGADAISAAADGKMNVTGAAEKKKQGVEELFEKATLSPGLSGIQEGVLKVALAARLAIEGMEGGQHFKGAVQPEVSTAGFTLNGNMQVAANAPVINMPVREGMTRSSAGSQYS